MSCPSRVLLPQPPEVAMPQPRWVRIWLAKVRRSSMVQSGSAGYAGRALDPGEVFGGGPGGEVSEAGPASWWRPRCAAWTGMRLPGRTSRRRTKPSTGPRIPASTATITTGELKCRPSWLDGSGHTLPSGWSGSGLVPDQLPQAVSGNELGPLGKERFELAVGPELNEWGSAAVVVLLHPHDGVA